MEIKWGYPGIDCIFIADTARVLTRMIFHSFPGRCVFCSVLDLLCPLFVCCFLCGLFLGFVCLVHFSSDVLPCILWQFRCAQDWPSWLQFEPQVSVVLSHSTMDYYHWNGYEQRTLWSHHFVQVHQHKGFYPLQTKWSEFWPVRFPRGKAVDSERAVEREIIWGTQKIRSGFPGTHSLLRPLSQSLALNSMDLVISSSGLGWELPLGAPRRTYRILRAATTWILQTETWWNGWGFQAYLDQLESDDGNLTGTKWNKYEGLQPIECGITRNTMELGLCIHYA